MMKLQSVICELNPIHRGHCLVFDRASAESDVVCAVMSGNFVQRGEPAIFDKYTRAHAAVLSGCDIVLELPFPWCAAGVESFALGGVCVAHGVNSCGLTFGSETGELDFTEKLADIKASPEFEVAMRETEALSRDAGSAVVFERTLERFGIREMPGANDKLGAEYIRQGRNFGMTYTAVKRISDMKSAATLRQMPFTECEPYMPHTAYELLSRARRCRDGYAELLFNHARLYLRDTDNPVLQVAAKKARNAADANEFMNGIATKKYTAARMRRELLFSMAGVEPLYLSEKPRYTILLAANERGRRYLSENRKKLSFPVITKPADYLPNDKTDANLRRCHITADEIYCLINGMTVDSFVKKHPIMV